MRKRALAVRLARITRQLAVLLETLVEEQPDTDLPDGLPPIEQGILEALSDGSTLTGKRIAKRSQYAYSPRLRQTLADMTRRSLLAHGPDGYRIASTQKVSPRPLVHLNGEANGGVNGKPVGNGFHRS